MTENEETSNEENIGEMAMKMKESISVAISISIELM